MQQIVQELRRRQLEAGTLPDILASPAIAGDCLLIWMKPYLYRIGRLRGE